MFIFFLSLLLSITIASFQECSCSTTINQKFKILFVVRKFPYSFQTFIINQLQGLIDQGHDVYILAENKVDSDLPLSLAPYHNALKNKVFYKQLPPSQKKFDIIYCQLAGLAKKCIQLKQNDLRGKLVISFRDTGRIVQYDPTFHPGIFKEGALLMPVCNFLKDRLIQLGAEPNKIIVLHSAIDCSKFTFKQRYPNPDGSIRIVSICRLVEQKGIQYSIKAVAQLLKKYNNIEYFIIGEGYLHQDLQNLINNLGVHNKIKLLGRKTHGDVQKILNSSHIFILPSVLGLEGRMEGIPNALKEAMAMGLPVVSTYHSGIPELVENRKSGFLVAEGDVNALIDRLEYLINHPEMWPVMGLAGRQKVEQEFDMKKENDKLIRIFQQLLQTGAEGYNEIADWSRAKKA